MIRAVAVEGTGETVDRVVLGYDERHRRRLRLATEGGLDVLLDLPEARHLRAGDRLVLEDGRRVLVEAASEELVELRVEEPRALARLAWHLGNRHTPAQILERALRIRPDPVLEAMAEALGARIVRVRAPFDPESGAYAHHGHEHG